MEENELSFDHIHIISEDPRASAAWYVNKLGATINSEYELRSAPQINVSRYIAAPDGVSIELVQAKPR